MRRLLASVLPRTLAIRVRGFQLASAAAAASSSLPLSPSSSPSSLVSSAATNAAIRQLGPARSARVEAGRNTTTASPDDISGPLTGGSGSGGDADLQQELRQLEAALARHNDLYYNHQRPELSDAAYDNLKRQYRQLAGRLRGLDPEEVTLAVGAPVPPVGSLRKLPHPAPMLSLAAVDSREETTAWMDKTLGKLEAAVAAQAGGGGGTSATCDGNSSSSSSYRSGSRTRSKSANAARDGKAKAAAAVPAAADQEHLWVVEPKVDGLAVRVLYRRTADGSYQLAEAATRGDGAVGEDVTHNALHGGISGLPRALRLGPSWSGAGDASSGAPPLPPLPLPPPPPPPRRQPQQLPDAPSASAAPASGPDWVDVRGEVFVRSVDFELANRDQEAAGQTPFANARNAASGAVRLLDPAECRRRRLSFVAYAALAPKPPPSPSPPPSAVLCASPSSSLLPPPPPPTGGGDGDGGGGGGGGDGGGGVGAVEAGGDRAGVGAGVGPLHGSHWRTLHWLKVAGFAVSPDNAMCSSGREVLRTAEEWMARRGSLGYDADGAVIKLDDTTLYDTLGTAGSDPRWAVAWKFPGGEAVTRLEGVELTVGRQGQITPVALLAPVKLGGVTVRRASLHNVGLAARLGLHVGDAVVLRRSGDVIPQVVRVVPELRPAGSAPWLPPSACPACGGRVRLLAAASAGSGDQLLCDNPTCGAKSERRLLHFAAVCLKGSKVSQGVVGQLLAAGLIRNMTDFYRLDEAALAALPGFGPARVAAIAAAVEASRRMPVALLLRGLNIRLVGEAAAGALGAAFPRLQQLAEAPPERIEQEAGVGPAVARSVAEWFQRPDSQELVRELREAGIACVAAGPTAEQTPGGSLLPGAAGGASTGALPGSSPSSWSAAAAAAAAVAGMTTAASGDGVAAAKEEEEEAEEADRPAGRAGPGLVGVEGLSVCVTGTLMGPEGAGVLRNDLRRMLEEAGAEFHPIVKRDTRVLLAGYDAGKNKTRAAASKGIRVMEEAEFWRLFWSNDDSLPA